MPVRRINKILVYIKKSAYSLQHDNSEQALKAHEQHARAIHIVQSILAKSGLEFFLENRKKIRSLKGYNLVMTLGGDGTFLRASHQIQRQLILGINSMPTMSVGALLSIHVAEFSRKLDEIRGRTYQVQKWSRLQITVNGKKLPVLAVNDVLFANHSPGGMSRYIMGVGNQHEEQKSSGIWIATAAGSTAAIRTAGGKKMSRGSQSMQFLVREPYLGVQHYKLLQGTIAPKHSLVLVNKTSRASLFIDGLQFVHPLHFGDEIHIKKSPLALHVVR